MPKERPDNTEENNEQDSRKWGRIFMGAKISELSGVEAARSRAWDEKDEAEYYERVKARATEKAREILNSAEAEAAAIRQRAKDEGYAEGSRAAQLELDEIRMSMSGTVSAVMAAIQEESRGITRAWREDLAALVRLAVEKTLGLTLEAEKSRVLENLYLQAVQTLENTRNITVRVNPEDEAAVADIIGLGRAGHPDLESWLVKGDPSVTPGGLIVESASSLADNTIESRKRAVDSILDGLTVPE